MANLPVPAPYSATTGAYLTSSIWNASVRDGINFLTAPPVFSGYQSVSQSVPNNAFTPILFDSETLDSAGGHSTSTNTSRYTVQTAGTYFILGTLAVSGTSSAGARAVRVTVNGNQPNGAEVYLYPNGTSTWSAQVNAVVACAVGDYIEIGAYQNSGGSLSTTTGSLCSNMAVVWISK